MYYLFWAFITECHSREVVDSNRRKSPISVEKVVLHVEIWIENLRIFHYPNLMSVSLLCSLVMIHWICKLEGVYR